MIIGERFAYGHIPKTGGDAVRSWFARIPGHQVDDASNPHKHDFFWERRVSKPIYVLSLRRLPNWALSNLHQMAFHPDVARLHGIDPSCGLQPEHAFLLRPDEFILGHQSGGRTISVWLRMEYLFDDVIRFVDRHVQPMTPEWHLRLQQIPVKGPHQYDHNVDAFIGAEKIRALYDAFPIWTSVERAIYGHLHGEAASA